MWDHDESTKSSARAVDGFARPSLWPWAFKTMDRRAKAEWMLIDDISFQQRRSALRLGQALAVQLPIIRIYATLR